MHLSPRKTFYSPVTSDHQILVFGGFDENGRSNTVSNDEEFQKSMLRMHNEYRKRHGVPPLKLAEDLSKYAQDWAETLTKFNKLEHRQDSPFGENLFCLWGTSVASAKDACLSWYNEVRHFNYHQEPRALKSPNFTQMLWRDTKEIGVGRARGRQGNVYIVANYRPQGNIVGQFKNNVFRPL